MLIARFIEWLENRASLKTVVILVMLIIPFNVLLFPWVAGHLEQISGYRLIDALFWYTPAEVFARLNAYQASGRNLYLISDWTLDLLYPLVYSLLFGCILTVVLRAAFPPYSPLQRLQLIPFLMAMFDYLENISISLLLVLYPIQPDLLARMASAFTSLKWCFAAISLLALAAGLIKWIITVLKPVQS